MFIGQRGQVDVAGLLATTGADALISGGGQILIGGDWRGGGEGRNDRAYLRASLGEERLT